MIKTDKSHRQRAAPRGPAGRAPLLGVILSISKQPSSIKSEKAEINIRINVAHLRHHDAHIGGILPFRVGVEVELHPALREESRRVDRDPSVSGKGLPVNRSIIAIHPYDCAIADVGIIIPPGFPKISEVGRSGDKGSIQGLILKVL